MPKMHLKAISREVKKKNGLRFTRAEHERKLSLFTKKNKTKPDALVFYNNFK